MSRAHLATCDPRWSTSPPIPAGLKSCTKLQTLAWGIGIVDARLHEGPEVGSIGGVGCVDQSPLTVYGREFDSVELCLDSRTNLAYGYVADHGLVVGLKCAQCGAAS